MSEESIIRFCSPTLANLKSGGLFRSDYGTWEEYLNWEKEENQKLNPSGVYVTCLRKTESWVLIYVYRRALLQQELSDLQNRAFLLSFGYPDGSLSLLLEHLRFRIATCVEFPHEIGLFLGYPLDDVKGFWENMGRGCLFTDYWRVYANPEQKRKRFARFRQCSQVYEKLFAQGRTLQQLTVAL